MLRTFYKMAPFNIKGGLPNNEKGYEKGLISCLIISNKIALLNNLLEDLKLQTLPRDLFEVVIVFDLPGKEFLDLIQKHKKHLNITYHQSHKPLRVLSNLRNISVSLSSGEFFLFLDDDTRIFQSNFLESGLSLFKEYDVKVVIPHANSLYGIMKKHYDFLDQYSFTNRCCFYHRQVIENIGGFLKDLQTYEDIELSIRLMINDSKVFWAEELDYFHPPLYFDTMQKPLAIGQTIFQMCRSYSLPFWLLVYFNALRFLPYGLIPGQRNRQWFKISLGVLLYPFTGKSYYY